MPPTPSWFSASWPPSSPPPRPPGRGRSGCGPARSSSGRSWGPHACTSACTGSPTCSGVRLSEGCGCSATSRRSTRPRASLESAGRSRAPPRLPPLNGAPARSRDRRRRYSSSGVGMPPEVVQDPRVDPAGPHPSLLQVLPVHVFLEVLPQVVAALAEPLQVLPDLGLKTIVGFDQLGL